MENEKLVLEKFSSLLNNLVESVVSIDENKKDNKKIDKLIKDIENLNLNGNEDTKSAIASLKRAKDLDESYNEDDIIILEEFIKNNKES